MGSNGQRPRLGALLALGLLCARASGQDEPPKDEPPKIELVATTEARSPEDELKGFRLPPGFEAQLVVSEPEIAKPMNLAFDDRGRLWATVSREYPYPAKVGEPRRDRVVILEDFGPDGRARKITTFADDLNIPIGVQPLGDGRQALVHSIPDVYLMTDDDGDGRADRREVAYSTFGFRDTHGMASAFTIGFDGWIHACHGFANTSTVAGKDGEKVTMQSGNTYRLRPDGSHIEQRTWGQVNPFGLAFDPLGNLYSADCHSRPIYQLLPGAYYPSFGKPHDGLGYGPEMMQHDHYSTGIAGIVVIATDSFPDSFRGNILIGNVVTSRINRDHQEWRGSTPKAVSEPDLVVSDDPWFRPVDLEIGPDGALYVADFYNRIIGHYEVPLEHPGRDRDRGRIWRIVYKGDDVQPVPPPHGGDFTAAGVAELVDALDHPNLAVRMRATNVLAGRGDEAVGPVREAIKSRMSPRVWIHGLWTLHRLGALEDPTLESAAGDEDPSVRGHAMRVLTEKDRLEGPGRELALKGLLDSNGLVRRCAAEALGRHPATDNIRPLLDARHAADSEDTHLVHVVRMALRDQFRDGSAWPKLAGPEWSEADLRTVADVAPGVHTRESARYLLGHLRKYPEGPENLDRYVEHVARFGDAETDRELAAFARGNHPDDIGLQAAQLRAIHRGLQARGAPLGEDVRTWAVELSKSLLDSDDGPRVMLGAEIAGEFRLPEAREPLARIAGTREAPEDRRLRALTSLTAIEPASAVEPLTRILGEPTEPAGLREQAANLLGQNGRPESKEALATILPTLPAKLQGPAAVALAADRGGADKLLELVSSGKASPRLLQDRPVEVRLRASGVEDLDSRLETLTRGLPPAEQAIQELISRRQEGFSGARDMADAERGSKVFEKNCASCHQVGGNGARIGPQLDGIGARGSDRLLEDILDPNRNVDQAFRATTVALEDGRVLTGLILNDEGEVIVLADNQGKEARLPKDTVAERQVTPLSPMPANMAEQIEEKELYDLLAFLLSKSAEAQGK